MKFSEFYTALDQYTEAVPLDELVALLTRLEIDRAEIEPYVKFADDHYARNVLHLGSGYVALILCWKAGQFSPVHDHAGSACGVRVIEGEVTETRYIRDANGGLAAGEATVFREGSVCGSYDADTHTIGNALSDRPLVTLHVYTPPMDGYHTYDLETGRATRHVDLEVAEARRLQAQGA